MLRLDSTSTSLLKVLMAYYHPVLTEVFQAFVKGETPATLPDDAELREAATTVQKALAGRRHMPLLQAAKEGEDALTSSDKRILRNVQAKTHRITAQAEYRFVWEIQNQLERWGARI
jgi:hypothetical protein